MIKRFQNRISESRFLLPFVAIALLLLWFFSGLLTIQSSPCWIMVAMTSYLLVELDTKNSIMRIYSRMIPAVYLVLTTMAGFYVSTDYAFDTIAWVLFLSFLFASYQDRTAAGKIFFAFFFLSIASLRFVQILYFIPILWVIMQTNIMVLSRRTLSASVVGLILPYWFIWGYLMLKGDISYFATHFSELGTFVLPFDVNYLGVREWVTISILILLFIIGTVHYIRQSSKDKIRTRMFLEMIITTNVISLAFILLQPVHFASLLPIIIINTSFVISHFIVLTNTKMSNRMVYVIIALVMAATIYNLWII